MFIRKNDNTNSNNLFNHKSSADLSNLFEKTKDVLKDFQSKNTNNLDLRNRISILNKDNVYPKDNNTINFIDNYAGNVNWINDFDIKSDNSNSSNVDKLSHKMISGNNSLPNILSDIFTKKNSLDPPSN